MIWARCTDTGQERGACARATRLLVRKAVAELYFNRVPSLPATDDGSARPLAEDLSTGSGDGEDTTRDADVAGTDEMPASAEVQVRSEPVQHASELA